MDGEKGSDSSDAAVEILLRVEYVASTVSQIHEQLSEFQNMRTSLAKIEGRLSSSALTHSFPLGKMKKSYSNTLDWDVDPGCSSGCVYGMVEALEEQGVASLPLDIRRRYRQSLDGSSSHKLAEEQPDVDVVGLHQPAQPPPPEGDPCQKQLSSSFSCVSLEEPSNPRNPSMSPRLQSGASPPPQCLRKMSLDHLRSEHNAAITMPGVTKSLQLDMWPTTPHSALPRLGWFLLAGCGILDFCNLRATTWARLAIQTSLCGVLLVASLRDGGASHIEPSITTILYFSGSLLAVMSLRFNNVASLFGIDGLLDEYANRHGFCEEWTKISRVRLMQTLCGFVLMIACRVSALFVTDHGVYGKLQTLNEVSFFDVIAMAAFTFMAGSFCGACYCVLHITTALELSVDAYAVGACVSADMEMAVVRWNEVQATLRHTSTKLSELLIILASSCVGVVIMFAYKIISLALSGERFAVIDIAVWMGWLYSPLLIFLYVLSKSAAVTEKVDRLGPVVNSWIFEDAPILDERRQYVVNYISNSRAGFYARGIRVTASSVQKLSYYFAAASFGLLANLWK